MLILIYAVVILGGTGSLTGMIVGAVAIIVSSQVLDSTAPPNNARVLFYAALIATVCFTMRSSWVQPDRRLRRDRRVRAAPCTRS